MATAAVKPSTATLGSIIEKSIPAPDVTVSAPLNVEERKEAVEHFNNWPNACGVHIFFHTLCNYSAYLPL